MTKETHSCVECGKKARYGNSWNAVPEYCKKCSKRGMVVIGPVCYLCMTPMRGSGLFCGKCMRKEKPKKEQET